MGALIILVAFFVVVVTARVVATRAQRRTFIFLVRMPNWVFLPLPIGASGAKWNQHVA